MLQYRVLQIRTFPTALTPSQSANRSRDPLSAESFDLSEIRPTPPPNTNLIRVN